MLNRFKPFAFFAASVFSIIVSHQSTVAAESRDLVVAAYSVPKEAYERIIIPAFQRHWKTRTGQEVQVRTSYTASGAQARAIIGGFEAAVAAVSL